MVKRQKFTLILLIQNFYKQHNIVTLLKQPTFMRSANKVVRLVTKKIQHIHNMIIMLHCGCLLHFTQGNLITLHFYKFFSLLPCHIALPSITKAGNCKQQFSIFSKVVTSIYRMVHFKLFKYISTCLMKIPHLKESTRKYIVDYRFIWT